MDITSAPRYRSHKTVQALKVGDPITVHADGSAILSIQDEGFEPVAVTKEVVARYMPVPGDYLVIYEDGYRSISPAKAFEAGYTLLSDAD